MNMKHPSTIHHNTFINDHYTNILLFTLSTVRDKQYCGIMTVWLEFLSRNSKCKLKIVILENTRHCDKIPWNPGTVKPALHSQSPGIVQPALHCWRWWLHTILSQVSTIQTFTIYINHTNYVHLSLQWYSATKIMYVSTSYLPHTSSPNHS